MIRNKLFFTNSNIENINAYTRRMNDELNGGEIGYYHLPCIGIELVKKVLEAKDKYKFNNVVLVGVGGSSLGVKAVYEMLNLKTGLIFLDNLDPYSTEIKLSQIHFDSTVFILSSKSGTTIETISIFKYIVNKFRVKTFDRFIVITDPNSPLENYAKAVNIEVFNIPKNVGGRFSVLSATGLVPLGFCGCDIEKLLEGAMACKSEFIDRNNDLILQKAYHYATHGNARINVLFSYSDRFVNFNDWYVQLWAESLGKKRGYKRIGLTPVGLIGSKDQHSFLQLIIEGPKDKTVTFIIIKDHGSRIKIPNLTLENLQSCDFVNELDFTYVLNSQARSTMQALISENISVDCIEIDFLDEWHIGWLIYYYELLTSATGIMLGIDAYDQPGVEVVKRILKNILTKDLA